MDFYLVKWNLNNSQTNTSLSATTQESITKKNGNKVLAPKEVQDGNEPFVEKTVLMSKHPVIIKQQQKKIITVLLKLHGKKSKKLTCMVIRSSKMLLHCLKFSLTEIMALDWLES